MRNPDVIFSSLDATPHFIDYVKMILDIVQAAVRRQLAEQ